MKSFVKNPSSYSEEIPHAIGVNVDRMVKESEDRVHIEATIYVERDSQKELSLEKAVKVKRVGKTCET